MFANYPCDMNNSKIICFFAFFIFGSILFGQKTYLDSVAYDSLKVRVEKLEKLLGGAENTQNPLVDNSKKLLIEFTNNPILFLLKYGTIFIAILAIILASIFLVLNKLSPKWYTNLIQKWVEKYEEVNRLKEGKKILVVNDEKFENEKFIKKFFDKKGFKNVRFVEKGSVEKILKSEDYDLIFANNEGEGLVQEELETWLKFKKYSVLFYFGKPGSWDYRKYEHLNQTDLEFLERLNFANSRSQIYGNLLSTLNLHDTLI